MRYRKKVMECEQMRNVSSPNRLETQPPVLGELRFNERSHPPEFRESAATSINGGDDETCKALESGGIVCEIVDSKLTTATVKTRWADSSILRLASMGWLPKRTGIGRYSITICWCYGRRSGKVKVECI
jgi:hypothetical protein